MFVSVYYHTACSYPNCKPEDVIGCAAAQSDHKRFMSFMKWRDMKQAVVEISDDDEDDKNSNKDKVASPSLKVPSNPCQTLPYFCVVCNLPVAATANGSNERNKKAGGGAA